MNTPQFQQLKHRINHGQTPDIDGETFTAEQVNEVRYYLRFQPEYLATMVAQQEKTEAEQVNDISEESLNENKTEEEIVETPAEETQPTKKTKATKK